MIFLESPVNVPPHQRWYLPLPLGTELLFGAVAGLPLLWEPGADLRLGAWGGEVQPCALVCQCPTSVTDKKQPVNWVQRALFVILRSKRLASDF